MKLVENETAWIKRALKSFPTNQELRNNGTPQTLPRNYFRWMTKVRAMGIVITLFQSKIAENHVT